MSDKPHYKITVSEDKIPICLLTGLHRLLINLNEQKLIL